MKRLILIIACVLLFTHKVHATADEGIFWISGSNVVMTGSIDVTGANTNVPGVGTAFLTELGVGSDILVSSEIRIIATITNDTTATVTIAWGSDLGNDTSPEIIPYATLAAFEADLVATLTGNLTVYHRDEESSISTQVVFTGATATYLLKITAESGAEHTGALYGNGARIALTTGDTIGFNEIVDGELDDIEISNLAIDASGTGNDAIIFNDGGNTGSWLADRLLIKGDTNTNKGYNCLRDAKNVIIRNSIVYGIGNTGADSGIHITSLDVGQTYAIYNNTVIKNFYNIFQDDVSVVATATLKNNLCQGHTGGADYRQDGAWPTTAKNISEDATSPDVSYRSKDVHTNSVFLNYASNDYRLDGAGGDSTNLAIVDDGENLYGSGVTEDIAGTARTNGTPFFIGASHTTITGGAVFIPKIRQF